MYVDKEFIGGCDILLELHSSGKLEEMLGSLKSKKESSISESSESQDSK